MSDPVAQTLRDKEPTVSDRAERVLEKARSAPVKTENPEVDRELVVSILHHELHKVEPATEAIYASHICEVLEQVASDIKNTLQEMRDEERSALRGGPGRGETQPPGAC
jgi:hypothetical protein